MLPRRLLRFRDQIVSCDPAGQNIPYNPQVWGKYLGEDLDFKTLNREFHSAISRNNLRDLSERALTEQISSRQLFLATMIWGFGTRGTPRGPGASLTKRMLDSSNNRTILDQVVQHIRNHQLQDAYRMMFDPKSKVKWCGPSFATKFLYVVGIGAKLNPSPLVLDSRIAKALSVLVHDEGYLKDRYTQGRWGWEGYLNYITDMEQWSHQIGCSSDVVEYFLFEQVSGFVA